MCPKHGDPLEIARHCMHHRQNIPGAAQHTCKAHTAFIYQGIDMDGSPGTGFHLLFLRHTFASRTKNPPRLPYPCTFNFHTSGELK